MTKYSNTPAPKAPASLPTAKYDGDPTYVLPRKGTGPATTVNVTGQRTGSHPNLNMKPSQPKVKNSGVVKA